MSNERSKESQHVVLVTETEEVLGIMDKYEAHHSQTPLHKGCSAFLFNKEGELLIQQRSHHKKTWPLFWSNSFCGHPQCDETYEDAVHRHAAYELNATLQSVTHCLTYRYHCTHDGIMENEICYAHIVTSDDTIIPNPAEIEAVRWLHWSAFVALMSAQPDMFTPWCKEESALIAPTILQACRALL